MDKEILLRKYSLKIIFPFAKRIGIAPEFLFILRIFFGLFTGIILLLGNYFLSVFFLTICQFIFLLDYVDGPLARDKKRFSLKLLEIDRAFHYIIPFVFLFAITISYFLKHNNSFFLIFGLIGSFSILITLGLEVLLRKRFKVHLDQIRTAQDDKRKSFSNLRSFLIIDSSLSLFYLLILFNFLSVIIILFSFIRVVMLFNKMRIIKQIIKKRNIKKELSEYYTGSQASNYDCLGDNVWKDVFIQESKIIEEFVGNSLKGKLIDVACGTGRVFPCYGNRKIYGVDISKEMLEYAKKNYPHANVKLCDAIKLPFKSKMFSVAVTARFICHTPEYKEVIKEMVRVTKKGGSIIADFPNKHSPAFLTTKIRIFFGGIRYFNFFTYSDVEEIARENNLKIAEVEHKAFLPPKIFSKHLWFLTKKLNKKLIKIFPNFSTPWHVRFVKLK